MGRKEGDVCLFVLFVCCSRCHGLIVGLRWFLVFSRVDLLLFFVINHSHSLSHAGLGCLVVRRSLVCLSEQRRGKDEAG